MMMGGGSKAEKHSHTRAGVPNSERSCEKVPDLGSAAWDAPFQGCPRSCGRVVFSHVTCFPPSNYSKSEKNVYIIIIANEYTTKQHLEVSQSSYVIRGRKKKRCICKREAGGGLGGQ